jgi:hypothetical protein
MRLIMFALLTALSLAACQVHAAEPRLVAEYTALPGESMDAFALRISPAAQELSYAQSNEVCGEFRWENDRFAIALYSIDRLKSCAYVSRSTGTGVSYHTHIFIGIANFHREGELLRNPRFSNEDYSHPGYLSSGRLVMHQAGPGTDRRVRLTRFASR